MSGQVLDSMRFHTRSTEHGCLKFSTMFMSGWCIGLVLGNMEIYPPDLTTVLSLGRSARGEWGALWRAAKENLTVFLAFLFRVQCVEALLRPL